MATIGTAVAGGRVGDDGIASRREAFAAAAHRLVEAGWQLAIEVIASGEDAGNAASAEIAALGWAWTTGTKLKTAASPESTRRRRSGLGMSGFSIILPTQLGMSPERPTMRRVGLPAEPIPHRRPWRWVRCYRSFCHPRFPTALPEAGILAPARGTNAGRGHGIAKARQVLFPAVPCVSGEKAPTCWVGEFPRESG